MRYSIVTGSKTYRITQMWAVGGTNCGHRNSSMCQKVASNRVPVKARLPHTIQRSRSQFGSRAAYRKNAVRKT
jgi:hypothetical protein